MTAPPVTQNTTPSDAISSVVERLQNSVVSVRDGTHGSGSGVIWRDDGLIVTNDHVARSAHPEIVFLDQEPATADVIGRDRENDLAVLRVASRGLPDAPIADSRELRVGQLAIAIGHPLGLPNAASVGIINGLPNPMDGRALIRADIALTFGNSGGPLANARGEVIGINAMVMTPGIGLAVPSYTVGTYLLRLLGPPLHIGITAQPAQIPGGDPYSAGLIITGVERDSPAETAQLLTGDVIVRANGRQIAVASHLLEEIARAGAGGTLRLTVIRAGEQHEIRCQIASRP